jgi:hypothetical protein
MQVNIIILLSHNIIIMTKVFITFGAGGKQYKDAGDRLLKQADNIKLFDKTVFYNDNDLKNDENFWSKHSSFISKNKRGYGYWLWKPYLIQKTMSLLNDGDILMYLDAGCEIDIRNKNEIEKYFEIVKKDYICGTLTSDHPERKWCKMDLLIKLDMVDNDEVLDSIQRQAGAQLIYVCNKTRELINEWYTIVSNDYHMIDDTKSIAPNYPIFKEHRHDQSTFSLLTKKYNLFSSHSLFKCVQYGRNKSGKTNIKYEFK